MLDSGISTHVGDDHIILATPHLPQRFRRRDREVELDAEVLQHAAFALVVVRMIVNP
jgi:hypothetical protein